MVIRKQHLPHCVRNTRLELGEQSEDRKERGLNVQLGFVRWTLEILRRSSQLTEKEGLELGVVIEEGKGGHAMLVTALLLTAGPLAKHP